MDKRLKRWMIIGMLLTISIVVSYLESFIPIFVPGVKLGLANVIILIMLYDFKWYEALIVDLLRILVVSFIRGTFLTPTFLMSLSGGILSYLIMLLFSRFKFFSCIGVSILGSLAHASGQILIASFLLDSIDIFYYLTFIMLLSLGTGILSGIISRSYLKRGITKKFID